MVIVVILIIRSSVVKVNIIVSAADDVIDVVITDATVDVVLILIKIRRIFQRTRRKTLFHEKFFKFRVDFFLRPRI